MANTITGLIPTLYDALNVVSREMIGLIPAVTRDTKAEGAQVGQVIRTPIAAVAAMEDAAASQISNNTGDAVIGYADLTISKSKVIPIRWTGEEEKGLASGGNHQTVLRDQFAEAMRGLVNAVEADIAVAGKTSASRAVGSAGTAPFATAGDLSDFANALKVLEDNGVPRTDLQLALNSAAMLNLRGKQSVLFKVNEAGSSDMLRDGMTQRIMNFALRYSSGFGLHTKGAGSAYVANGAAAVGASQITVKTGSGTVLAGDVVTFGSDANKYVVGTGIAAPGTLAINKPGLLAALADGGAMTIGNSYTPNLAFARTAIVLATRAPAVPSGGDSADDATYITDPVTGLTFEVRVYREHRQVRYEVGLAWGVAVVKPEHVALLLG